MNIPEPHFLLFSEAQGKAPQGQWRFVLQAADGSATLEATDVEPALSSERLELLAVVRGLEALDQPSRVTLFTPSRYVSRGVAYGLDEWRRNHWTWERFGEMVPVKNSDLWRRLDQALSFHSIDFRSYRLDPAHQPAAPSHPASPAHDAPRCPAPPGPASARRDTWRHTAALLRRALRTRAESWKLFLQQLGTSLLPKPWLE